MFLAPACNTTPSILLDETADLSSIIGFSFFGWVHVMRSITNPSRRFIFSHGCELTLYLFVILGDDITRIYFYQACILI